MLQILGGESHCCRDVSAEPPSRLSSLPGPGFESRLLKEGEGKEQDCTVFLSQAGKMPRTFSRGTPESLLHHSRRVLAAVHCDDPGGCLNLPDNHAAVGEPFTV